MLIPVQALLQLSGRGGIFKHEQEPAKDTLHILRISGRTFANKGGTVLHLLR
jgi:hypothetical protein